MADGISFSVDGLEEVLGRISEVSEDLKMKGGRSALRKAAKVTLEQVKANVKRDIDDPRTQEDISKNIAIRWSSRTYRQTGNLAFRVGVLGGARKKADTAANRRAGTVGDTYAIGGDKSNPGGDTWYWRLIEFGFTNHKSGQAVPPKSFMRKAIAQSGQKSIDTFISEYEKSIDQAIKRAQKKAAK